MMTQGQGLLAVHEAGVRTPASLRLATRARVALRIVALRIVALRIVAIRIESDGHPAPRKHLRRFLTLAAGRRKGRSRHRPNPDRPK
jgi:hypothetical protein